jgi:hypothetical protein
MRDALGMMETPMPWNPASCRSEAFSARDNDLKRPEEHGMNVPGPFYTGQTDNCWTGRLHAPRHVLYGGEFYDEFVYRQPTSRAEVESVVAAAETCGLISIGWNAGNTRTTNYVHGDPEKACRIGLSFRKLNESIGG